mmetsp:Transcript_16986/g.50700  ORF Transcript_16986/g.50700 Transcript_16986/m.50700 type:complete len:194 (+) Transcript_16986:300-881(+)|eukprot:CAMPEP_0206145458 /NCGR_PEP_ID=MMETSP1473-20131121/27412_1 /ASSEMBLY_ACC=CAM_ASM_001109 /TAXON_ID=1461547 /ORGANISM="Stichococcus sp, Strain RCC1054" /LENGTH=193 /DNA_ID=CAMNT_0053541683 /DNA_START=191 /DNA_END=772 /DNA_ORIENTATION=+
MAAQFNAEKHGPLVIAGAVGFGLGVAAHAIFARPAQSQSQTAATPLSPMPPAPPASDAGTMESVPTTPRLAPEDSAASSGKLRMALIVQLAEDKEEMPRGRTAVLAAHAVLQQYKKLYRKRDPARGQWEKDGGIKQMYAASEDELMACRSNAKAEDVPTFLVKDPRSQKVVVCIGPAPGARMTRLLGDLQELA